MTNGYPIVLVYAFHSGFAAYAIKPKCGAQTAVHRSLGNGACGMRTAFVANARSDASYDPDQSAADGEYSGTGAQHRRIGAPAGNAKGGNL